MRIIIKPRQHFTRKALLDTPLTIWTILTALVSKFYL